METNPRFRGKYQKREAAPTTVPDMAKVMAAVKVREDAVRMDRVIAAIHERTAAAPRPVRSATTLPPEDAARRGRFTHRPRHIAGIHFADFGTADS